jgi:hypothetical protein
MKLDEEGSGHGPPSLHTLMLEAALAIGAGDWLASIHAIEG